MNKTAINTFGDGLVSDFHPLTAKATTLIDALNATLVTTKGNEMILLNDTGNILIKVGDELVQLTDGFIPIGIKEYNGVLYIASYNPGTNEGELGSYPAMLNERYIYKVISLHIAPGTDIPTYSTEWFYYKGGNAHKVNKYLPLQNFIPDLSELFGESTINETDTPANDNFVLEEFIFRTTKLNFDLEHPVTIEIQPSYDGSVNLILTDDKNPPRLINSGFSVSENWSVPERLNNFDNIYREETLDLLTSLIKRTDKFPEIEYKGVLNSGNLKVGNYTLYFKYADDDGNETDFIAWSNIISIFKGNDGDPFSIDGGIENMNAFKSIQVTLTNLDPAYRQIKVYYTRTSSAIDSNRIPLAFVIDKDYPITEGLNSVDMPGQCDITITGEENVTQIPISEINTQYFIANTAKTEALCQNMLFLGNTTTAEVPYEKLNLLSLGIYPTGIRENSKTKIGYIDPLTYLDATPNGRKYGNYYPNEYYNTKNIYYNVGYWNEEFYRLGIVYVLADNTKTPVFNILGGELLCDEESDTLPVNGFDDTPIIGEISPCGLPEINWEDDVFKIGINSNNFINKYGVIHFNDTNEDDSYVYSIQVTIPDTIKAELRKLGIKGYFIVRQKRIPTIIALAYTLPWDKEAKVPIITYKGFRELEKNFKPNIPSSDEILYFVESFMRQCSEEMSTDTSDSDDVRLAPDGTLLDKLLTNEYYPRLHFIKGYMIDQPMLGETSDLTTTKKYKVSVQESDYVKYSITLPGTGTVILDTIMGLINRYETNLERNIYIDRQGIINNGVPDDQITIPVKSGYTYKVLYKLVPLGGSNNTWTDYPSYTSDTPFALTGSLTVKVVVTKDNDEVVERTFSAFDVSFANVYSGNSLAMENGYVYDHWEELNDTDVKIVKADGVTIITEENDKRSFDILHRYYINRLIAKKIDNKDEPIPENVYKHFYDLYKYCNNTQRTAICPEFELRLAYYNTLFTGSKYFIKQTKLLYNYLVTHMERKYNIGAIFDDSSNERIRLFKIVSVTDNVPIVAIDNTIFKSVIGSEAEAYRFSYINEEHCAHRRSKTLKKNDNNDENKDDFNLVRGIYSPYLGIVTDDIGQGQGYCKLFNIYYPNTFESSGNLRTEDLFKQRMENNSAYYPITSIKKLDNNSTSIYNGDCFLCTFTHRVNRNFNDPTAPTNDHILDAETWRKNYDPDTEINNGNGADKKWGIEKLNTINRGDVNAVKLGSWITIKVKASYNLSIRSLDESHLLELGIMGRARGFYPLLQASADGGFKIANSYVINDAFGATVGEQYYNTLGDVPYINTDYANRIAYSDIDVTGSFKNGYRMFRGLCYRDYTKQYGAIIKLVEIHSNLLCVFEHGVALIPVNERALAAEGAGGEVYINNSNVLPETPKILNDMYGSQWQESVLKTPYYIYGIDAARKKIWRTNGSSFEIISDFRVEKFLVDNLTINDTDALPLLGIKNIATHYNANKSDVMFTFYVKPFTWDITYDECGKEISRVPVFTSDSKDELAWNLCYNEILNKFQTFYSWIPICSENIDNLFYSFDRESSREIINNALNEHFNEKLDTLLEDRTDINLLNHPTIQYLWKHGENNGKKPLPTNWYGELHPFEFEFIVNETPMILKIYNSLQIISNSTEPESFHFTIEGDNYEFSNDKPNMYVRQEATKDLFQNVLNSQISFNANYEKLLEENLQSNSKSTIFPLYYNKVNSFNTIYNSYTTMLDKSKSRDYSELSGSEISWDEDLLLFFITTHIKNQPIDKFGSLRGNSRYLEGKWNVQIPSITLMLKNEYWKDRPPLVINPAITASDFKNFIIESSGLPNTYCLGDIDTTNWTYRKETKIRDKYCKIRIRYSGTKLAVISAIITTFTLSYA